jgi:hypothetical protein
LLAAQVNLDALLRRREAMTTLRTSAAAASDPDAAPYYSATAFGYSGAGSAGDDSGQQLGSNSVDSGSDSEAGSDSEWQ